MTPENNVQQLAEKIARDFVVGWSEDKQKYADMELLSERIAAALEENDKVHDDDELGALIHEAVAVAVEERVKQERKDFHNSYEEGRKAGERQGLEYAAKIAEKGWLCNHCAVNGSDVAELIRRRAEELK